MESTTAPFALLNMLNAAIAREMQVSIQYMLQHAIWNIKQSGSSEQAQVKQDKFVGKHSSYWLPGTSLKKIAIAEMRHAEVIAERIVQLGGEPTTEPSPITIGETPEEILEIDKAQEEGAIQLYSEIIKMALKEDDGATKNLFQKILSDEEDHHRIFSELLEKA
jgi:bacterioferritin